MCPDSWQNQYDLSQDTIPQDSRRLLIVLENIEKLGVTPTVTQKTATNGNETPSPTESRSPTESVRVLIPLRTIFRRRSVPRNIASYARNMGARRQLTIPVSVLSTTRMGILSLLGKASRARKVRNPMGIPTHNSTTASRNSRNL